MITSEQIEKVKLEVASQDPHYEHEDCIRIAYEWLDAQKKTKNIRNVRHAIKHLVERWAGRYVSKSDVEVAAHLHPEIKGKYPCFNISSRLAEPSVNRLQNIAEANTQGQREWLQESDYSIHEQ